MQTDPEGTAPDESKHPKRIKKLGGNSDLVDIVNSDPDDAKVFKASKIKVDGHIHNGKVMKKGDMITPNSHAQDKFLKTNNII
jgi:hypothetical protein